MAFARYALVPVALLITAACSSTTGAETTETAEATATAPGVVSIANQGGALEGHTPTAFAGMGTGLFAGDNLNVGFPEGVGVQTYLTFELPSELDVSSAQVISDALHVSGTPFEDLGSLVVEPVEYDSFGPELFDLAAIGPPTACMVTGESSIRCDATETLNVAVSAGEAEVQLRLRFEVAADSDGRQDLALFYLTDSNTNEAGIFELAITPHS